MTKRVNKNRISQMFVDDSNTENIENQQLQQACVGTKNQHKKAANVNSTELSDAIWKHTPLIITERILYELLVLRLRDKCDLDFYEGGPTNKPRFNESPNKRLKFEEFTFLVRIERDFVNYTRHGAELKGSLIYKNNELNTNTAYLRKLMTDYVRPNDLKTSLVAGGYFSKYQVNNAISKMFGKLFKMVSEHSDVDIYINAQDSECEEYMRVGFIGHPFTK